MLRRPAAVTLALLAAGALTACAAPAAPMPSETTTTAPVPTETAAAVTVGPGEKPPVMFDDDCDAAVSSAAVSEVVGVTVSLELASSGGDVGNIGGLTCTWRGESGSVIVGILPASALVGVEFPSDQVDYYFEQCDPGWVCAARAESEDLWIAASYQLTNGMTRDGVDGWTAEIAGIIEGQFASVPPAPWVRDDAGWWPVVDCADLAARAGAELGTTLTGEATGYPDPPLPHVLMAAIASNVTQCSLTLDPALRAIEVFTSAGEAWTLPITDTDTAVDTGVDGITAYADSGYESVDSAGYSLTDGVNAMIAIVPTGGAVSGEQILSALAAAAASGWE